MLVYYTSVYIVDTYQPKILALAAASTTPHSFSSNGSHVSQMIYHNFYGGRPVPLKPAPVVEGHLLVCTCPAHAI